LCFAVSSAATNLGGKYKGSSWIVSTSQTPSIISPAGLHTYIKSLPFLGRLSLDRDRLIAGEWTELLLTYEVGGVGLADGAWTKLAFKFYSNWALFQTTDPTGANYVSAEYHAAPTLPGQSVLIDALDRDRPHAWPGRCLRDRLRIITVIHAALDEGFHVLRRDQLHPAAHGAKHPAPMMSPAQASRASSVARTLVKKASTCARRSSRRSMTRSCSSTPCNVKICFDVSIDIRLNSIGTAFYDGQLRDLILAQADAVGRSTPNSR
jgi:hypothetical protein